MKTARSFDLTLRTAYVQGDRQVPAQVTLRHDGAKPVILVEAEESRVAIPLPRLARLAVLLPHLLGEEPGAPDLG